MLEMSRKGLVQKYWPSQLKTAEIITIPKPGKNLTMCHPIDQ
jgi:hypothetical protein